METLTGVLSWLWRNVVPVLGILGFGLGVWNLALARAKDRREREKDERERRKEGAEKIKEREAVEAELAKAKSELLALDNAWAATVEKFNNDRMLVNREMRQAERAEEDRMRLQGTARSGFLEEQLKPIRAQAAQKMEALEEQHERDREQYEFDRKNLLERIVKLEGKRALL